jgi:hypothetical protein
LAHRTVGSNPPIILRSSNEMRWGWGVVWGGIFFLTFSLPLLQWFEDRGGWGVWIPPSLVGCILAFFVFLLWSTKLVLTEEAICYRSAFVKKTVSLNDVVEASILIGSETYSYEPLKRLVVITQDRGGLKRVVISLGYFNFRECEKWLDALNEQLAKHI